VPGTEASAADLQIALELATSAGVPLPDGHVLVAVGASVDLVDLASGRRLGEAHEVAPAGFRCEVLSVEDEGMAACYGPGRSFVFVSHLLGAQPRVEMHVDPKSSAALAADDEDPGMSLWTDPTRMPVSFGAGMALVGATCAGVQTPGVVCARHHDGQWVQSDVRSRLRALGQKPWRVEFWVPKEDGGVAAVIGRFECNTGDLMPCGWGDYDLKDHDALLDVTTGAVTHFDHENTDTHAFGHAMAGGHRYAPRRTRTGWIVTRDGTLHGFATKGYLAVDRAGKSSHHERAFRTLSAAGGFALAHDWSLHWQQSTDYGATWTEVAGSPRTVEPTGLNGDPDCSLAGCFVGTLFAGEGPLAPFPRGPAVGAWLRVGWPAQPPSPGSAQGDVSEHPLLGR
jgi:hypothetical protein